MMVCEINTCQSDIILPVYDSAEKGVDPFIFFILAYE